MSLSIAAADAKFFKGGKEKDPAPSWRWKVVFPQLPSAGSYNASFQPVTSLKDAPYVDDINLPFDNVTTTPKFVGAHYLKFPNFVEVDSIAMTACESTDYTFTNYLLTWRSLRFNPYGMYFNPYNRYVFDVLFQAYSIVDDTRPVLSAIMREAFVEQVQALDYSYDSSTYVKVSASFACRGVEFFINPTT